MKNVPLTRAQEILENDHQKADPLLDFLLWAVTPNVKDSPEYDEVIDFLCLNLPEFRTWRNEQVNARAA